MCKKIRLSITYRIISHLYPVYSGTLFKDTNSEFDQFQHKEKFNSSDCQLFI